MFVGDTGGNTWRLKIESGSSYTSFGEEDPWVRLGRKYGVPELGLVGREDEVLVRHRSGRRLEPTQGRRPLRLARDLLS